MRTGPVLHCVIVSSEVMLFCFVAIFTLFSNNVFIAAQSHSSCQYTTIGEDEECGLISVVLDSPLAGGRAAAREEMRWQAGVYTKRKQPYMQICGGSLVSNKVVISAAHCFWSGLAPLPASDFAVALGKLYRPWNDPKDENAQKSDIRDIRIPPRFHGSITNFQDDIALLILATPIVINSYVLPVCLDFDYSLDKKHLADGNLGKVAGWGRTDENGKPSPILQVLDLPAVDVERCFKEIEPTFMPAITSDKICAGRTTEGTAVCMGDSGGGLAFPENSTIYGSRFYLRGVVSTAPKSVNDNLCNIYTYATFTHIAKHEQFIREVMLEASVAAPVTESIIDPDAPPIPDISSLPSSSDPGLFRPIGEVVSGGKPRPLSKGKSKKKFDNKENGKTDGQIHSEKTQNAEDAVTQTPSKSDNAEAVFTIQVIDDQAENQDEPSTTEADRDNDEKSRNKLPTDSDASVGYTVKVIEEVTVNKTKLSKPQRDPDAEAEYTVKIIEEPTGTQTKPSILKVNTGDDAITQNEPSKTQRDPQADAEYTVKIVDEPILSKIKPSSQTDSDKTKTNQKPRDPQAEAQYTVQIIEDPVTLTSPTKTDQTTEKQPFLSISSQPFLSTGTKPAQTDKPVDDQPINTETTENQTNKPFENQPIQSTMTDNQFDKSIENLPSQDIGNQASSTSNPTAQSWNQLPLSTWTPTKSTQTNRPPLSAEIQPVQSIDLPKTSEKLPAQSTDIKVAEVKKPLRPFGNPLPGNSKTHPENIFSGVVPVPSISNQPIQNTENPSVTVLPTGNQQTQTFGNSNTQPGNQLPLLSWNNPVQSTNNQPAQTTGNPTISSIGNQPVKSIEQTITGSQQSVDYTQSVPSTYTTQTNPDISYVEHKWNKHQFGYHHHHYPYNFHHDHQNHENWQGHDNGHYHHDNGHYHHDNHQFHQDNGQYHHDNGQYHHDYHYHSPNYNYDWHNFNHQW